MKLTLKMIELVLPSKTSINAVCLKKNCLPQKGVNGRIPGLFRCEVAQRRLAFPGLVNGYSRSVNNRPVALGANPPHASQSPQSFIKPAAAPGLVFIKCFPLLQGRGK